MKKRRPVPIVVIALLQIIPVLLLPPKVLLSINRLLFVIPVVIFALLAWALLDLRPVGRLMTIFVQGFHIIVRLLITLSRVVPSKAPGTPADIPLLVTSLLAIALSALILFYVDQPEMQLLFEA
ncbi:MAG: hypothetical protein H5T68_09770 [Chloroflexi bacterium]|nr:hypothetical protein [Chloroflexota bacterium]